VLLYDDRDWMLADCEAKDHSCYFERISNCRVEDILSLPQDEARNRAPVAAPSSLLPWKLFTHSR
jgi:hypothetical protein